MNLSPLLLLVTVVSTTTTVPLLTGHAAAAGDTVTNSTDILLNCGSTGRSNIGSLDNRTWLGDVGSEYSPTLTSPGSNALFQSSSVSQIPYMTARIFTSQFTYSFPLSPGRKFLRLHFYPTNYSTNFYPSDARFKVTAGSVTLLNNFSTYQNAQALNMEYLILEYSVNVSATVSALNVTFVPSKDYSNSYAFVNGIEVVSIPDIFGIGTPTFVDGKQTPYTLESGWAVQNVYRLNVGGQPVSPITDSGGLFRSWADDSPYIYGAGYGVTFAADSNVTLRYSQSDPPYIAPSSVYLTGRSMGPTPSINLNYNLTWILSVDGGFNYLVRMHFCEILYPVTKMNMRVFNIYINNITAILQFDAIVWCGGIGRPCFHDFVVFTTGNSLTDLWVALQPDAASNPFYYDAILNGLEVFKLENPDSNLAGPNPEVQRQTEIDPAGAPPRPGRKKPKSRVPVIAGGVAGGAAVIAALLGCCLLFMRRRQRGKKTGDANGMPLKDGLSGWIPLPDNSGTTSGSCISSLPSDLCRHFSFAEIEAATCSFDEALLLGVGGFGDVFRGDIDGGSVKVAIKRGNPLSGQGIQEFQTEIEMLSKLRHRHLVSLIGYCQENREMILVYDFMAHGTLREHLYKTQKPPLSWKQRLEICIGAARGLHYLHTGSQYCIIHRDVKTTNILLDENWVAKVSDFGLSKTGPTPENTHVSTVVKGSFGYLDPEYFRRQRLTNKSDVYSFGVVLFEVLCARPALNQTLPKEQVSLAEWAKHCQKKGTLDRIVDPYLKGKISPDSLKKYAETAEKCVADKGIERPAMADVLWNLEFALHLQETAEERGELVVGDDGGGGSLDSGVDLSAGDASTDQSNTTTTTTTRSTTSAVSIGGFDELAPGPVFSQIVNPNGR